MGSFPGGRGGSLLLLLLLLLLFSYVTVSEEEKKKKSSISISKVKIPPYVIRGQTVHLYCLFDLKNGTDLYTLKWFKDGAEFYRSVPRAPVRQNRRLVFPRPGLRVDFENSKIVAPGMHQVALIEVELATSGYYMCQITMDAPPFEFVERGNTLTVISLPERFPVISGNKGQVYQLGDWVHLNCTCYDSYPPATLRWFINGEEVPDSLLIRYVPGRSENGLASATLGLSFEIDETHLSKAERPFVPMVVQDLDDNMGTWQTSLTTTTTSSTTFRRRINERELWALCKATMPPIEGTVFPYTREVFLGSFTQTFDHFQSTGGRPQCSFHYIITLMAVTQGSSLLVL